MVLINDNGKKILCLEDDKLIYYGRFRKIFIKKSDIRSLFYDETTLGILLNSGKIYSLKINKLLFSERSKLEELRLNLNKENVLFDYAKSKRNQKSFPIIAFAFILANAGSVKFQILIIVCIALFMYIDNSYLINNVVFNIDKDEFEVFRGKHIFKYKRHEIDKINIKKYYQGINNIEFKKNGNRYIICFKENPYLIKIYNTSLSKLFN